MNYFFQIVNWLVMLVAPFLLGWYLQRRLRPGWRLFWIGAVTFILSQVFHIPFNALVQRLMDQGVIPTPGIRYLDLFTAAWLGLSAGLFEETARYLVLLFWAKEARSWRKGVMFGAGHGGAESAILGGLVLLGFINFLVLSNRDLATILPPDQIEAVQAELQAYAGAAPLDAVLGALERLLTIPIQITFAVIVLQAFTRGSRLWWLAAVAWHTLTDASIVYVAGRWGIYPAEIVLAVFTLLSLAILFALRRGEPPEPEPAPDLPPLPPPLTADQLPQAGLDSEFTTNKLLEESKSHHDPD